VAQQRKETGPRSRPVWDVVGPWIEALLAELAQWTGRKQRLRATRLHALLVAEGHQIGLAIVEGRGCSVEAAAARDVRALEVSAARSR
jgi:hypothetical protein